MAISQAVNTQLLSIQNHFPAVPPHSQNIPSLAGIWQLLELHRPALAEAAARQRLAADPVDWPTLLALAEALRQQERLSEARQVAQAAILLAPEAAEAHYALAQVRGQLGQLPETVAAVDEALRLAPHHAKYYGYRARLYYAQHRYPAAIRCAEDGLRLDPEQPNCLLWRALAQEALDQPTAADQDFARLLHIAPVSSVVHTRLGQLLLKRGELTAAAPHFAEALRQAPEQAPQLIPLLRQARKQAVWPGWLQRAVRRELAERGLGIAPGFRTVLVRLALVACDLRAAWFPRPDPLFPVLAPPPLVRPWAATPLAWAAFVTVLAVLFYFDVLLRLRAEPGIFMLTIFALRYLHKRQNADSDSPPF